MNILDIIEKANGKPLTKNQRTNAKSVAVALEKYGPQMGLNQLHRLVQYLAQLAHESAVFVYDRELWGPTPAQKRYDTRTDLGNTKAVDGDGKLYAGRTGIQVTGKANYRQFTKWAQSNLSADAPDFVKYPEQINTDPWEGAAPLWYWSTRELNRYADSGDVEMITRKINGGYNGLVDRIDWLVRFSLVANGYAHDDVSGLQKDARLIVDGIAGPKTRAALHKSLVALTNTVALSGDVRDAPVVQDKLIVPKTIDAQVKQKSSWWEKIAGGLAGSGGIGAAIMGVDWQTVAAIGVIGVVAVGGIIIFRRQIINTVKDVRQAAEA